MSPFMRKLYLNMISLPFGFNAGKAFKSRAYDSSFMSNRIVSCKGC